MARNYFVVVGGVLHLPDNSGSHLLEKKRQAVVVVVVVAVAVVVAVTVAVVVAVAVVVEQLEELFMVEEMVAEVVEVMVVVVLVEVEVEVEVVEMVRRKLGPSDVPCLSGLYGFVDISFNLWCSPAFCLGPSTFGLSIWLHHLLFPSIYDGPITGFSLAFSISPLVISSPSDRSFMVHLSSDRFVFWHAHFSHYDSYS
ncbi:hypothetical protein RchiOBHm_Chr7g0242611 [Rosa chinensis]|uniref:Transmembrane protein n=1 Tax=Rosa chinensis TaxID=74649 RepID=A0A2P6PII6_ROSCH|nr:hypothetical protein RchiOBHm_Chr7g0242611 [Rosa chinensis]